jgi:RHS repeat-associated protein
VILALFESKLETWERDGREVSLRISAFSIDRGSATMGKITRSMPRKAEREKGGRASYRKLSERFSDMTILSSDPNTVPQYNALGQLTKVRYNADQAWTGSPANWDRWVDYDYTAGSLNRYYVNDNGDMRFYAAAATNQYTGVWGSAAPSYDGNFNLTAYNGFQGVYDAENHLVGGSMQATYDGLGRCVRRTTPSGTLLFTYDGWKPILEWGPAGNWTATNVYGAGADEILSRQDSAGRILIYKQDQHGNVVAILSDNGDVTEKYSYDAFGKPKIFDKWGTERTTGTAIGNRFLFQGREWVAEPGIYDFRHRMYQPELGRFLQTDPMGLQTEGEKLSAGQKALFSPGGVSPEAFTSSEMNLFRYCGDDPVDGSDPLGLEVKGDDIDFEKAKVSFVTIPGADKYGGLEWALRPNIVTEPVAGGYRASIHGLDVVLKRAQIATRVKVKGERVARYRSDNQINATIEHEKQLHGGIAKTFDRDNQNRESDHVYRNEKEARSQIYDQLYKDFDKAQNHDNPEYQKRFEDVMKRESFR